MRDSRVDDLSSRLAKVQALADERHSTIRENYATKRELDQWGNKLERKIADAKGEILRIIITLLVLGFTILGALVTIFALFGG